MRADDDGMNLELPCYIEYLKKTPYISIDSPKAEINSSQTNWVLQWKEYEASMARWRMNTYFSMATPSHAID